MDYRKWRHIIGEPREKGEWMPSSPSSSSYITASSPQSQLPRRHHHHRSLPLFSCSPWTTSSCVIVIIPVICHTYHFVVYSTLPPPSCVCLDILESVISSLPHSSWHRHARPREKILEFVMSITYVESTACSDPVNKKRKNEGNNLLASITSHGDTHVIVWKLARWNWGDAIWTIGQNIYVHKDKTVFYSLSRFRLFWAALFF